MTVSVRCLAGWVAVAAAVLWMVGPAAGASPARSRGACPTDCVCAVVRNGHATSSGAVTSERRVRCLNPATFTSVEAITNRSLARDTTMLDISSNLVSELRNRSFRGLTKLERLNLAKNQISVIRDGAFGGLDNLLLLNLSYNNLRTVHNYTFSGLKKLEKLLLRGNQLSRLPTGVFGSMQALHNLDISQNPWICDCRLHWLLAWQRVQKIQPMPRTTCQFPPQLRDLRLHKIKPDQWHCNWPLQVPLFDLQPSVSQVTFAGDPLTLHCHVSLVEPSALLSWTLNDAVVGASSSERQEQTAAVVAELRPSADGATLLGQVSVPRLDRSHGGTWACWLRTAAGENETRSVTVRVLPTGTGYCAETVTAGNKGRYVWPPTVGGVTVELPCWSPSAAPGRGSSSRGVTRNCGDAGAWGPADASRCPYASEVTKVLEQFAKTNLNITSSSAIESVHRLRNYTDDGSMLRDKMDVVFIARTIGNYLEFVPRHREVGEALVDIIGVVMLLDEELLRQAQLEDRACSSLVESVRQLASLLADGSLSRQHGATLTVEELDIKMDGFRGITCGSFLRGVSSPAALRGPGRDSGVKRVFRCTTSNSTAPPADEVDEILETSIQLPASLFRQLNLQQAASHRLQFVVYRNAALFPRTNRRSRRSSPPRLDVASAVIGVQLARLSVANLSDPVIVTVRCPHLAAAVGNVVTPAWWDFAANDWSGEGCSLWSVYGSLVTFRCDRLADFGVLQDVSHLLADVGNGATGGSRFHPLHPIVYVGSGLGVHCLLAAIISYVLGFRLIHVAKKDKHSLINTWLAAVLLCLTFTLGVRHTEDPRICQAVGLVLHYLSLACLLWMLITASNCYKKLAKSEYPDPVSDEPAPDNVAPKPILRFYLLGWGVPVIVCGISGAVNLEDYAGHRHCFLAITHSVGAFYGPCGALVIILCVFYLLIYCLVRRAADSRRRSVTEIELTEAPAAVVAEQIPREPSVKSRSDGTGGEEEDAEQGPLSRLRGQVATLVAFLVSWAAAAVVTVNPFNLAVTELGEVLAASVYAATALGFGVLVLCYHCVARDDVRMVWRLLVRCRESGIARETEPLPAVPTSCARQQPATSGARGIPRPHHHGARSDDSFTSNSNRSCRTARSPDDGSGIAPFFRKGGGPGASLMPKKVSNLDAAIANAGGVTDTSWSGEMFYNERIRTHQNGVARKFFRKHHSRQQQQQHRHHHHKNEYAPPSGFEQAHHNNYDSHNQRNLYRPPLSPQPTVSDKVLPCLRFRPAASTEEDIPSAGLLEGERRVATAEPVAVSRDRSNESQLFSSSSQGLVSVSPSHSGNFSERSLLIVEEEEEEGDATDHGAANEGLGGQETITSFSCNNTGSVEDRLTVDWGSCADPLETSRDAIFTPSPTADLHLAHGLRGGSDDRSAEELSPEEEEEEEESEEESPPCRSVAVGGSPSPGTERRLSDVFDSLAEGSVEDESEDDESCPLRSVSVGASPPLTPPPLPAHEDEAESSEEKRGESPERSDRRLTSPGGGSLDGRDTRPPPVPRRPRGETLPRGNWEAQWSRAGGERRRPRQPVYAYVNHSYHQRLGDDGEPEPEMEATESRALVRRSMVHRSASTGDADLVSGEDPPSDQPRLLAVAATRSDANLWVREPKLKKETAV